MSIRILKRLFHIHKWKYIGKLPRLKRECQKCGLKEVSKYNTYNAEFRWIDLKEDLR